MIASHAAKSMPRDPNAGSATRGFGSVAFTKLIRQLHHPCGDVRIKALQVAEELLAQPKSLMQCVEEGICVVLAQLLQDKDERCQELAADRLRFVMRTPSTAAAAAAAGVLPLLLRGMVSYSRSVRKTCYQTLFQSLQHEQQRLEVAGLTMDSTNEAIQRLLLDAFPGRCIEVQGGTKVPAVTFLLACAMHETREGPQNCTLIPTATVDIVTALPLQLLEKLAQKRNNENVLDTLMESGDTVVYLASLLTTPCSRQLQLAAVKLLTTICTTEMGKVAAVKADCIVKLIGLTTSGHMELTVAATGALAAITTCSAGKQALFETGEVLLFVELLDWNNLSLERNILSIIANAAENLNMRAILMEHGVHDCLARAQFPGSSTLRKARELAIQQVAFGHRPFSAIPQ
eukprot:jgi/Ulvmu1/5933/UM026_0055.1